jgi:hypothetical protein
MARRFGVATKVHAVVLEDLEAWHQQLWEEVHAHCCYEVYDPPAGWDIRPAVTLRVVRREVGKEQKVLWEDYATITRSESGAIEAAMLRLASKALLELQGDMERAQRQTSFA